MEDDLEPTSLIGRRFSIDPTPVPTTPLAKKLERKENMKRHRSYQNDYDKRQMYAISMTKVRARAAERRSKKNGQSTD